MFLGTRVLFSAPLLFLLSAVLIAPPLNAFPVDKGSFAAAKSFKDLPPGSVPAIAMAMLKDLPVEYQLRVEERTFTVSNPAHAMKIDFTPNGIQVASGDRIVIGASDDDLRGSSYVFNFDYPIINTEQWGLILDNGLGSASLTFFKKQDGTITADGNWKYIYLGSTNVGTFTGAPVTISGKSIILTATGTATNPSAPPGYTTSPYTGIFSGTAFDGQGIGIFTVSFQTYGWPDKLSGSWQGTRTSGSGITTVTPAKPKALPWLMLLLGK